MEIYPVVHINDDDVAVEQASIALDAGASGVFLIAHTARVPEAVDTVFNKLSDVRENAYIGINYLQLPTPLEAYYHIHAAVAAGGLSRLPDAIWCDNLGSEDVAGAMELEDLVQLRDAHPELKGVQLLGGIAFKYTRAYTDDPEFAAKQVANGLRFVDVVTTSGEGTGHQPSPEKIRAMKIAAGDSKLAIASGVDADNLADYSGSADQILVASSIETKPYSGIFDIDKLNNLLAVAKATE